MTGVNMVEGRGEITIVHLIYGGGGGGGAMGGEGGWGRGVMFQHCGTYILGAQNNTCSINDILAEK